jgi:hypothetical protein
MNLAEWEQLDDAGKLEYMKSKTLEQLTKTVAYIATFVLPAISLGLNFPGISDEQEEEFRNSFDSAVDAITTITVYVNTIIEGN